MVSSIEVRAAGGDDVEAIARLAGELGYPAAAAEVRERLDALTGHGAHALFVAADGKGSVLGWIQLSEERSLLSDPRVEITGLVVDAIYRGAGVGHLLVERGENWARERGLTTMGVRSNILRERAHQFYLRLGYHIVKSQKIFRKAL